ncbi:MAG TPA: haloacid dehalogenase-like hydrolase [Candidatus Limnocylindrales bacterium]|nr:haloacid dehalogenase-like hydrolase [Candidatus Limnocylindrales bacterium]
MNIQTKLSPAAHQFVESVLALKPAVAVFDCDGTLWSGDSGADFFYWQIERGMLPAKVAEWALARYEDYKRGNVAEETMCGEMVTINANLPERLLEDASQEFFHTVVEHRAFPEMLRLAHELRVSGCDLWAVSSTNVWVVREGVKPFGIPPENVLAACVQIEKHLVTDRLCRVPSGPGKATALKEVLGKQVNACFGNSIHDLAMLEMAQQAFAVNPNPDLEKIAQAKGWTVYWPAGQEPETANDAE